MLKCEKIIHSNLNFPQKIYIKNSFSVSIADFLTVFECTLFKICTECTVDMVDIDRQLITSFWSHKIALKRI